MNTKVLQVDQVKKSFKDVRAVDGISLTIDEGEYVALLGPNGAGKTTLVEMIEGLQSPDEGYIQLFGTTWKGHRDTLHNQIGISLQESRFIDKLSVSETLRLFASFYKLPLSRVTEVLELVGLKEKRKAYTVNLSGGQRQRLALAIALLNKPRLLMLDEPTTGLDPNSRREIWKILVDLKRTHKTSMVLTTHYMEEAAYLCDRIIIMDKGKMIASGTLHDLINQYNQGEIIEYIPDKPLDICQYHDALEIKNQFFDLQSGKQRIIVDNILVTLPRLMKLAHDNDISLISLECRKMTLDDLFISLTGRTLND